MRQWWWPMRQWWWPMRQWLIIHDTFFFFNKKSFFKHFLLHVFAAMSHFLEKLLWVSWLGSDSEGSCFFWSPSRGWLRVINEYKTMGFKAHKLGNTIIIDIWLYIGLYIGSYIGLYIGLYIIWDIYIYTYIYIGFFLTMVICSVGLVGLHYQSSGFFWRYRHPGCPKISSTRQA